MDVLALNSILQGLGISAVCESYSTHRHVSLFDLKLSPGERIRKLEQCSAEIALHMGAIGSPLVRPITEKKIVRLQLAHRLPDTIELNELYNSNTDLPGRLPFILGEDMEGKVIFTDMSRNPHMLVAGETGSGKTVFLHTLIKNTKRFNLDLWLVDPKRVEFNKYEAVSPIKKIVDTYEDTVKLLDHLELVVEQRFSMMKLLKISNYFERSDLFKPIMLIIDEVSDLMIHDKKIKRFQNTLIKIAQKSRAAGIFMVLATQRPSVDVIDGLIKANFPARVCFKVTSSSNSKVILDASGGQNLLGRGDALIKNFEHDYVRFQAAFSQ